MIRRWKSSCDGQLEGQSTSDQSINRQQSGGRTQWTANVKPDIRELYTIRKDSELSETDSIVEYPWEGTAARSPGRSLASISADDRTLCVRKADDECIEVKEGAKGQHALLRRGVKSNDESCKSSRKAPDVRWPSFDDDD